MPGTFLPVLAATGLGALVGLERQFHQGMAGLRTNALVASSAAAFVHLPLAARGDVHPASLAAAVISGIGFLGAGVILREGMNVRGHDNATDLINDGSQPDPHARPICIDFGDHFCIGAHGLLDLWIATTAHQEGRAKYLHGSAKGALMQVQAPLGILQIKPTKHFFDPTTHGAKIHERPRAASGAAAL